MDLIKLAQRELSTAQDARAKGNEGMARVCARRAAGWTVKAYLGAKGIDLQSNNVLEHFRYMLKAEETRPELRPILEHMLQTMKRDSLEEESHWPIDADLVAEARFLLGMLFPETEAKKNRLPR